MYNVAAPSRRGAPPSSL